MDEFFAKMRRLTEPIYLFLNKLSPLHIVFKEDETGKILRDEAGNPIPDRFEKPNYFMWILSLGITVFVIYAVKELIIRLIDRLVQTKKK